jgi:hypothetical protein
VAFYTVLFSRLALLAFGTFCIYITAKELFPGRMNPNSLFSEVFDKLRYNEQVSSFFAVMYPIYG